MIIADTIAFTTKCTGGCKYCPFSHPSMEKLHLDSLSAMGLIEEAQSSSVVFSGGEFFEFEYLEEVFYELKKRQEIVMPKLKHSIENFKTLEVKKKTSLYEKKSNCENHVKSKNTEKKFRIATGGHIPIQPYISELREIRNFEGISFGTDIIFRQDSEQKRAIWFNNLEILISSRTPYSLTFTIFEDDWTIFEPVLKTISEKVSDLQFVYLRLGLNSNPETIQMIRKFFLHANIIEDNCAPALLEKFVD